MGTPPTLVFTLVFLKATSWKMLIVSSLVVLDKIIEEERIAVRGEQFENL